MSAASTSSAISTPSRDKRRRGATTSELRDRLTERRVSEQRYSSTGERRITGVRARARNGGGPLGAYTDSRGRSREVVTSEAFQGSVLVIDRDAATLGDRRVVAHLAADEPAENAALTCRLYLEQLRGDDCRCRPLLPDDLRAAPFPDEHEVAALEPAQPATDVGHPAGGSYRLEALYTGMSIPELRWRRHVTGLYVAPEGQRAAVEPVRIVSLREAVAALESYEPFLALTRQALARASADGVSAAVLRVELRRVRESPIVLNRRLREVALEVIKRDELTLSEIAIRCGRVKRDGGGSESGETSWLARRLGILPEGGKQAPTPWIHSDVLALIARRGLGVSPREVELH